MTDCISQADSRQINNFSYWLINRLCNNQTAYPLFRRDVGGFRCTRFPRLDAKLLEKHILGKETIGAYASTPDNTCLWIGADIDHHDDETPAPEANWQYALAKYNQLRSLGFDPLLEDSNSHGGYHLWVLFNDPIPAAIARSFGLWLVQDRPTTEIFPKQAEHKPTSKKVGNQLRLPGKHHRRNHWSAVWSGSDWIKWPASIDYIMDRKLATVEMIPTEARTFALPRTTAAATTRPTSEDWKAPKSKDDWRNEFEGDLRTLDIVKLFDDAGLLVGPNGVAFDVICPFADKHSPGTDIATIWPGDENDNGYPNFSCWHKVHEGMGEVQIHHVLQWFGKAKVDACCSETFIKPTVTAEQERKIEETVKPFNPDDLDKLPKEEPKDKYTQWTETAKMNAYNFSPVTSAIFAKRKYNVEWLVQKLLVKNQPCILGGPKKSLKTTLATDLAISLGGGLPFLGQFDVPKKVSTAFISGESGEWTLQETMFRICKAKGIKPEDAGVWWDFRLPQLAQAEELANLASGLAERKIEVVIIDPLYLCLLSGHDAIGKQASNLFDMGPLLLKVARACLSAGATPILAAHARKNLSDPYSPMELEDLAFSGIQEFARQWLLVNRSLAYQPGTGKHDLWLIAGGSCGHGGVWGMSIDEGHLDDSFGGRKWDVDIASHSEVIAKKQVRKEHEKDSKKQQEDLKHADELLKTLDNYVLAEQRQPAKTTLNKVLGWDKGKFDRVMLALLTATKLEYFKDKVKSGNGAMRETELIRRTSRMER